MLMPSTTQKQISTKKGLPYNKKVLDKTCWMLYNTCIENEKREKINYGKTSFSN